jgi:hypothetical protein
MAAEPLTVVKTFKDGTVTLMDGGANSLALVCDGLLKYTIPRQAHVVIKDRGSASHVRPGEDRYITGSMSIKHIRNVTTGAVPMPQEVLTHTGAAAAWTTTNTDNGGVFTQTLKLEIAGPGTEAAETVTLAKCKFENLQFSEGEEADELSWDFEDFETAPTYS